MNPRGLRPRLLSTVPWPVFAAGALALGLGALIPIASTVGAQQLALIVATAAVLATPIALRAVRREFDPFEPVVIFVAVWGLIFVARPLSMRATDDTLLRGKYDIEQGVTAALLIGLVGGVAFLVGYWASERRPQLRAKYVRRGPPPAWVVAVPTILGLGMMTVLAGSTFTEAAVGGASSYEYLAPLLTIPAIVLLQRRGNTRLAYALLAVSVAGFLGLGQRAFVIWPISSAFVFWYMSQHKRPGVAVMAAVVVVGVLPLFTVLEVAREEQITPTAALSQPEARDPGAAIERFSEGDTTAMFPALALQMQTEGSVWHQRPGYWVYSTVTRWIPAALWSGKLLGSGEYLYSLYFPRHYNANKASTAFSLASEFYYDLGILGVILGMGGTGWLCGRLWLWVSSRAGDPWMWALYAPVFGLVTILFRGDAGLASGLGLFVFAPLLVARWAATARPAQTENGSTGSADIVAGLSSGRG